MLPPSSPDLLAAWERGAGRAPTDRALALLAVVLPDHDADALASMSVGARDRRLLDLRRAAFGPTLNALMSCVACGETLELDCAVDDLRTPDAPDGPVTVEAAGYRLVARQPDSRDLRAAALVPPERAEAALLARCLVEIRRDDILDATTAEQLPSAATEAVARALSAADAQLEVQLSAACPACGRGNTQIFDIGAYLWSELDAWSGRILVEVHDLACAYGWSERDILALSSGRRRRYLEMVRA